MLNTIKNTIVFEDILGQVLAGIGREVRSMTAIEMDQVTEEYKLKRAEKQLRNGRVLIFGAGSGRTHFSTDLAAANRAAELGCDLFLKGTKVKGIFSKDPKDADAEFLGHLTPQDFIARGLDTIVDADGVTHAGKQGIPARVFNIFESGNLARILAGEDIGTAISIKQQDARS